MRAIFVALVLLAPLAACEESNPTFGSGGWQEGDVPEAVPVGDEPAPTAQPPAVRPPAQRPTAPATPEPETETPEAPTPAAQSAPPPVVLAPTTPPATIAPAPDPHAGHQMPAETPPTSPSGR